MSNSKCKKDFSKNIWMAAKRSQTVQVLVWVLVDCGWGFWAYKYPTFLLRFCYGIIFVSVHYRLGYNQ